MTTRNELHAMLVEALGSNEVYYQPPSSIRMTYPAIVYNRTDINNRHADNQPYLNNTYFNVVVISSDPDDPIVYKVAELPTAKPGRRYVADNLYHDPFTFHI